MPHRLSRPRHPGRVSHRRYTLAPRPTRDEVPGRLVAEAPLPCPETAAAAAALAEAAEVPTCLLRRRCELDRGAREGRSAVRTGRPRRARRWLVVGVVHAQ